jgi:hypothetical protein
MLSPILTTLLSKGGDQLQELLGEGQEVLDSPKYLNPPLVCGEGLVDCSSTPSYAYSLIHLINGS